MFDSQANTSPPQDEAVSSYSSTATISFPTTPSISSSSSPPQPSSSTSSLSEKTALCSKKYVHLAIPESKSEGILPNRLLFSCNIQCIHSIQYNKLQQQEYQQFDLDKLDIILNQHSALAIQCVFLLNGIDNVLSFPLWIDTPLNKVMESSGFRPISHTDDSTFQYHISKAFTTSPLSYLFDKQVPFGILEKIEIVFDWTSSKPKEFQSCWNRKLVLDTFSGYLDDALTSILVRKSFYMYPLIFSSYYTKKITQTMAYLPYISQSLQKIYTTSKATMSVSNHEFSESFMKNIKTIHKNTKIMNPHSVIEQQNLSIGQITTALTLGMYHSVKNANKPKMCLKKTDTQHPPNALYTVAQLWSITCSASSSE